ncbi:hypothetical protein O181_019352 [Austropuccinia psidii MF-1]|uniref:Uncharacterized protein n=1 Tax=Austropuccinia psidii MF-1 TaxID=1389203 RepID=A0A9Q3GUC2_9BASI|nr:hypothetical protein [Austropuccinia psidii MF-1]
MPKGKGKRHSESLISNKTWTLIATKRTRKPQSSASIQDEQTLIPCTRNFAIVNSIVTSKGKFPKAAGRKFVQGTVKGKYVPCKPEKQVIGQKWAIQSQNIRRWTPWWMAEHSKE